MTGTYEIMLGGQPVGTVQVRRENLYYCFSCRCRLTGDAVFQLMARTSSGTIHLGVPAPEGDQFTLKTRLPVKRFPIGIEGFFLQPRHEKIKGRFIPLSPQTPFADLSSLERAFLEIRDGQTGIFIKDETEYDKTAEDSVQTG